METDFRFALPTVSLPTTNLPIAKASNANAPTASAPSALAPIAARPIANCRRFLVSAIESSFPDQCPIWDDSPPGGIAVEIRVSQYLSTREPTGDSISVIDVLPQA